MSTDLQGWYISRKVRSDFNRIGVKNKMEVLGCNYGEVAIGMNSWDADEKFGFIEQVEATIRLLSTWDAAEVQAYRAKAFDFQERATALGLPVRSYWL